MNHNRKYCPTGKAIAHYLIDNNLTQAGFAEILGCTDAYVNSVMMGIRPVSIKWLPNLPASICNPAIDDRVSRLKIKIAQLEEQRK